MTGSNAEIEWYIARDGQQHGPLSDAEMRLFVESGHLKATDLLWRVGFTDWRPAPLVFPPRAPAEPQARTQPPAAAQQAQQPTTASQAQPAQQPQQPARTAAGAVNPVTAGLSQRPTANAANAGGAGRKEPRQELVPVANAQLARDYEIEPRHGRGKVIALSVLLLALIGGAIGYVATHKNEIMKLAGLAKTADKVPLVKAEPAVTSALKKPETSKPAPPAPAAVQPAAPATAATATPAAATPASPPATPAAAPPAASGALAKIDAHYQKSRFWSYMKREYPEWYGQNVAQAAKLIDAQKPDRDATRHMIEAMVALRRKNAELALKADTAKLKSIASAFLDNLQSLSEKGPDACYGFISQGEVSPAAIDLFHQPQNAAALETQAMAIFEAIGAGQRTPTAHDRPKKEDYDVLAAQLGKLGWSQADLQLFADPKALAKAEPARVCQMVRDWFKAHVSIADQTVQERLLFETLRPVVSG